MRNWMPVLLGLVVAGGVVVAPRASEAKSAMKSAKMEAVYVCKPCKEYTTAANAKKMHYKDSMGHKLTKMGHAPTGYKMMEGGAMSGGKMKDGKM